MVAIVLVEFSVAVLEVVLAQTWQETAAKITQEHPAVTPKTLPNSAQWSVKSKVNSLLKSNSLCKNKLQKT